MHPLSPFSGQGQGTKALFTQSSPAFYIWGTAEGLKAIVGEIDPKSLRCIQAPSNKPLSDARRAEDAPGPTFKAVYWDERQLPTLDGALVENVAGSRKTTVTGAAAEALAKHFQPITFTLIGDEARLQASIDAGVRSVPVMLFNTAQQKLPLQPRHRVVSGVDWFKTGWMVCLAREHMFFADVTAEMSPEYGFPYSTEVAEKLLTPREDETITMLAVTRDGAWRMHSRRGWADGLLQELHPSLREIASVQLHRIVLPMGVSLGADLQEKHVRVFASAEEAVRAVRNGSQVAFLLNPLRAEELAELVKHQQMLPADSVALDTTAFATLDEVRKNAR